MQLLLKLFQKKKPRVRLPKSPQGEVYNLQHFYDRVNQQYFDGKIDLTIEWFGRKDSIVKRRLILGSYCFQKKRIKIHRKLDQLEVPDFFLSYIIYHEMLHHVAPPQKGRRGRWKIHHSEFKEREKEFEQYELAMKFHEHIRDHWFTKKKRTPADQRSTRVRL